MKFELEMHKKMRAGHIKAYKVDKVWRVCAGDLKNYLAKGFNLDKEVKP